MLEDLAQRSDKKALLSSSLFDKVLLKDIIIDRDDSGTPLVKLPEQFSTKGIVNVSISHTDNLCYCNSYFSINLNVSYIISPLDINYYICIIIVVSSVPSSQMRINKYYLGIR